MRKIHCHCIFQDIWWILRRIIACPAFQNIKDYELQRTMSVQGVQNRRRPTQWVSWRPIWKWDCVWVMACLREHRKTKGGSALPAKSRKISYQNWQTNTIVWFFARRSFRNIFCRFLGLGVFWDILDIFRLCWLTSLIAEFGGSLGLFLGFSFMSAWDLGLVRPALWIQNIKQLK